MDVYQEIIEYSRTLTEDQKLKVLNLIHELLQSSSKQVYLPEVSNADEIHISNPACPFCLSNHVQKSGHKNKRQRYKCISCKKYFTETTHTIMENSHATKVQWTRVIIDTIDGVPIDKTAEELHLHHETVFNMRHKVMLGLVTFLDKDPVLLKEIAELDETYVLESLKGTKFSDDSCRKPRRHGESASKRGLSDEQICICTGVERKQGAAYAATVNRATPLKEEIQQAFEGHI